MRPMHLSVVCIGVLALTGCGADQGDSADRDAAVSVDSGEHEEDGGIPLDADPADTGASPADAGPDATSADCRPEATLVGDVTISVPEDDAQLDGIECVVGDVLVSYFETRPTLR